jgi:hypothetical protein
MRYVTFTFSIRRTSGFLDPYFTNDAFCTFGGHVALNNMMRWLWIMNRQVNSRSCRGLFQGTTLASVYNDKDSTILDRRVPRPLNEGPEKSDWRRKPTMTFGSLTSVRKKRTEAMRVAQRCANFGQCDTADHDLNIQISLHLGSRRSKSCIKCVAMWWRRIFSFTC